MIKRILEQERAIRRVLSEDRKVSHLVLKWQDIDVLTSVHSALEPLADLTDVLSGDTYVTVSSVKPTISFIANASKATHDDTNLTAELKAKVQANFETRYTSETAQTILNTATWLDPRYKTEYLTEEDRRNASQNIKGEMMGIDVESDALDNTPDSTDNASYNQPPAAKKKKSLAKLLGEMKKTEADPATPATRLAHIELEMSRYLGTPSIALDADPLQWWSMHAAGYPRICGTSSSSERLFSVAGNIITAKRSLLKPHKVDMLVFLAKNL